MKTDTNWQIGNVRKARACSAAEIKLQRADKYQRKEVLGWHHDSYIFLYVIYGGVIRKQKQKCLDVSWLD